MLPAELPGRKLFTDDEMLTLLRELALCSSRGAIGEKARISSLKKTLFPRRFVGVAVLPRAAESGVMPAKEAAADCMEDMMGEDRGEGVAEADRMCRLAEMGDMMTEGDAEGAAAGAIVVAVAAAAAAAAAVEACSTIISVVPLVPDSVAPRAAALPPAAARGLMGLSGITCSPETSGERMEDRRVVLEGPDAPAPAAIADPMMLGRGAETGGRKEELPPPPPMMAPSPMEFERPCLCAG